MIQPILCGWLLYLAVMAALMTASAGPRTWLGRLGAAATVIALGRAVTLWWPLGRTYFVPLGSAGDVDLLTFGPDVAIFAIALVHLLFAPRQDTRLIALLLAGAATLPVLLHVW